MNLIRKFIGIISDNLSIKISSLAIALTLWIFVVTGSEYVHVIEVPMNYSDNVRALTTALEEKTCHL